MATAQPMPEAEGMRLTHYRVFNDVLNGRNLDLLSQLCTRTTHTMDLGASNSGESTSFGG